MFRLGPARAHIVTRHFFARSRQNVNWNSNNCYFGSRLNCCPAIGGRGMAMMVAESRCLFPIVLHSSAEEKNIRDRNKHATDADIQRKPYDPRHKKSHQFKLRLEPKSTSHNNEPTR